METPSSVKALNNNIPISGKMEDSGNGFTKSRKRGEKNQQKPLIDITNDSPIIGLANGSLLETPTSSAAIPSKQRSIVSTKAAKDRSSGDATGTPGSGEALLRGQVKTLLQKVEEKAEFSKHNIPPFIRLQGFVNSSPMGIPLAPTPANTPQVSDLSGSDFSGLTSVTFSPVVEEQHSMISKGQVVSDIFDGKMNQETVSIESQQGLNRTLLFDFSDKSDASSEEHYHKECKPTTLIEDDTSSVWSVQVNPGEEEDEEEAEYYWHYNNDFEGEEDEGLMLDELCEGLENISVVDDDRRATKFRGKHSRFVYDIDDEEIVEVVVEGEKEEKEKDGVSSTPEGKLLRFSEEEEEEEEEEKNKEKDRW